MATAPQADPMDVSPEGEPAGGLPLFDEGDEFSGAQDDPTTQTPPAEGIPAEPPAGEPVPSATGAAAPPPVPPEPAGDSTPPDAMPGDEAFDAWAKADPAGAQAYLDYIESKQIAESKAAEVASGATGFPAEDEQAVNVEFHLQAKGAELDSEISRYNGDLAQFQQDQRDYTELVNHRKEAGEPLDDPALMKWKEILGRQATGLNTRHTAISQFSGALDSVRKANSIVDKMPSLAPYREIYVELFSRGALARTTTLEQQKAIINTELVARGLPMMGQKGAGPAAAAPVSPILQKYRALRSGTAPKLHGHSATAPPPPSRAQQNQQGATNLHPFLQGALDKIKAK